MVWVFKTSVDSEDQVLQVVPVLNNHILPHGRWNFDLDDRDKILRIEHDNLEIDNLISTLHNLGIFCIELED